MRSIHGGTRLRCLITAVILSCGWSSLFAQSVPDATPPSGDNLRDQQMSISGRYSRFERMLSQMADILGREDPERADLLRRAISKGREQRIGDRIDGVVKLLESKEFGTAVEEQQQVTQGLVELLKLLQSEDRRSSVEKERERLNNLLKDVRNLITEQRSARSANQNSPAPSNAAPQQQKAIDKAESMIEQIQQDDADKLAEQNESNDQAPTDGKSASGSEKPDDKDPDSKDTKSGEDSKDGMPKDSKSSEEGDQEKSSGKATKDGMPSEDHKSSSDSSQSPSQSQQSKEAETPNPQTPGREQIEQARNLMQQALDQLRQQQKDPALEKQDEAIAELQKAASRLEEMLRQLREEEKEMLLAALEARFQRMLAMQTQIHEGTLELSATPKENWLDQYFGRCRELAQQQFELTTECAQTVNMLQEDGTSVSILLAMEDIESDMSQVSNYLRDSKVAGLTQSVQTDIIEALKELIEATQQEMQEMKSEQRQQQQQQQNSDKKPPLVELMAEIRVLRSLQVRVNRRTKHVDELMQNAAKDEQADLSAQLTELADRQQRLIESAGELALQMQQ